MAAPLADSGIHAWDVGRFARDVDGARAELATASSGFDVTAPVEEVPRGGTVGRTSGRRLLVVGGQAAGLLLAFAALAAAAARRDAARWRDRLGWSGAAPWQAGLVAAAARLRPRSSACSRAGRSVRPCPVRSPVGKASPGARS